MSLAFATASFLGMIGALVYAVARALSHTRGGRGARAAAAGASVLKQGRAVVKGTVHTDDGQPAIVFDIRERGTERKQKGKYSHVWTETDRSVTVRPFELVVDAQTRVRVVAHDDVVLMDRIERRRARSS